MKALISPGRLVQMFRADVDAWVSAGVLVPVAEGTFGAEPACRCWRCGTLLIASTVRADEGGQGGTLRPGCEGCA